MTNLTFKLQNKKLISNKIDLNSGLARSKLLPWTPAPIDSSGTREYVSASVPIDGVEIVEWMHYVAADIAVFDAMSSEYSGGTLVSGSDDPYIPGMSLGNLRAASVRADTVRSRGYGEVDTPQGTFRVPIQGKAILAKGNLLAWGAIPFSADIQWVLTMLHWKELASTPITNRIRFGGSDGLIAPNFFKLNTRIPSPAAVLNIKLTSNRNQSLLLRGRGSGGSSYEDILFEDTIDIEAGENELTYLVTGFPFVSGTLELSPEDNTQTVLDYIEIYP